MFIFFTNHPSDRWRDNQKNEAMKYGEIIDVTFPEVDVKSTEEEVHEIAVNYVNKIVKNISKADKNCVLCQGEFTLSFIVINMLQKMNIKVVSACSRRNVVESNRGGKSYKEVVFEFCGFREYDSRKE